MLGIVIFSFALCEFWTKDTLEDLFCLDKYEMRFVCVKLRQPGVARECFFGRIDGRWYGWDYFVFSSM